MIRRKSRNDGRFARNSAGAGHEPGSQFLWRRAICGATWAEAQNLGDDTILRQLLEKVGVAATTIRPTSSFRRVKETIAPEDRPGLPNAACSERKRSSTVANVLGQYRFDFVGEASRKLM